MIRLKTDMYVYSYVHISFLSDTHFHDPFLGDKPQV